VAFNNQNRQTALFIDGPNLFATAQAVDLQIDYGLLLQYYKKRGNLLRAYYYTAIPDRSEQSDIRPLLDWLDYHGYSIVSKPTKSFRNSNGELKLKGNLDTELTLDVVDLADSITDLILFSGDGDFAPLLRWVQRRGVRTTVVSTCMSTDSEGRSSPMVADELRRATDVFIDIGNNPDYPSDLREAITRIDRRVL
jgi:uncharacterized LabA/DUF88 family protein